MMMTEREKAREAARLFVRLVVWPLAEAAVEREAESTMGHPSRELLAYRARARAIAEDVDRMGWPKPAGPT